MRIVLVTLLALTWSAVNAQNILTVDDVVKIALKNNFDILVARNDAEIARINNTPGNAGMLPGLTVNGSGNYEVNNVTQKLPGGTVNSYPSLSSSSLNAGAQLSWTLFDGGKMFVTKSKLNEIEALGGLQFRDKVLQTLYNVISAYYDIVRQKQQLISINESINFNLERVKIAQAGIIAGSLIRTDLLQANIDLNVITESAINQQYTIDAAKNYLNQLLGKSFNEPFEVSDSIPLNYSPDKAELLARLDSVNTTILAYKKQSEIARLTLGENYRSYSPVINFSGGYFLSASNSSQGSVLNNRSAGPQIGGSLIIPIYSSGENRRKVNSAKVEVQSAEYDLQNIKLQLRTELQNALSGFETQKRLLLIEKQNNELTRENLVISLQRLRLGQTTSLEVHQAQENFVQSSTRLIDFEYELKLVETKLKQLISSL